MKYLPAYLSHDLAQEEVAGLNIHLDGCRRCRSRLQRLSRKIQAEKAGSPVSQRVAALEPLLRRFTIITIAFTVLTVVLGAFVVGQYVERYLVDQAAGEVRRHLEPALAGLVGEESGGVLSPDLERVVALRQSIRDSVSSLQITRIALLDRLGQVVFESNQSDVPVPMGPALDAAAGTPQEAIVDGRSGSRLFIFEPLLHDGEIIGAVEIDSDSTELSAQIFQGQAYMALCFSLFGLVSSMLGLRSVRRTRREIVNGPVITVESPRHDVRQSERLSVAVEVARLLTTDLHLEAIIERSLREMQRIVPYHYATMVLVEADGKRTVWSLDRKGALERVGRIEDADEIQILSAMRPDRAMERGAPVLVADVSEAEYFEDRRLAEEHGFRCLLSLPLLSKGFCLGALNLGHRQPGAYSEVDIEVLRPIVESLAVGIENSRLFQSIGESEKHLRALVQNLSDVILVVDAEGIVRYVSPSMEKVLGYTPSEMVEAEFSTVALSLSTPEGASAMTALFGDSLLRPGSEQSLEFQLRHKDDTWRDVVGILTNLTEEPSVAGFVLTLRDVTERKAFEQQLMHQAFYDPLTGLPNRALFMDRLEQAFARAARTRDTVAVMFLDLDRFKVINDSLGHNAGDRLLEAVGQRLRSSLRPEDTIARFGGDEFTVVVESVRTESEATHIAERITEMLCEPFPIEGHEVFVTTSIGIAIRTVAHKSAGDLLRDADVALYRAKAEGRAHYVVFNSDMNAFSVDRLTLESDLRRAVERNELRLLYQPEVDLTTGRISGVEALVRWEHPTRGMVSPAQFIPIAEETGLVIPIGRWVLTEACRQMREWRMDAGSPPQLVMSVNISAKEFVQPELVENVAAVMRETGLPASCLKLEITERVLMEDKTNTVTALRRLKELGVHLAIDDFGIDYSSLSYLLRFPVDTLKIDQSFISGLGQDDRYLAIVRTVTSLAHALDMGVTAEGIETAEQLTRLRQAGCDRGQGYYFFRPLKADAMSDLLRNRTGADVVVPLERLGQVSG